jgi:hemolysin III
MDVDIPRLRGLLHAWAAGFALAAGIVLVVIADGSEARLAAAVYGLGLSALFTVSGLYHRWRGRPGVKAVLRRLDHSTIFIFIASSYTPMALLALTSPVREIVLISVWAGAVAGVLFSVFWIDAPRALVAGSYIGIGWVAVITMPQLWDHVGPGTVVLLGIGGLLYTLGALAYAFKRPNPIPAWFGFHEVFHALVIAAAVVHFVAIAGVVVDPVA